jgi:hypothetical protein
MNIKAVVVLLDWPQFKATTIGLKLLRQAPIDTPMFTKPCSLGKRHTIVEVPINYWVIGEDTLVKMPPTHMKSVFQALGVDKTTNQYVIASHWLPTTATLTIKNPYQPKHLMKLPISIRQD